ncbi:MAG TPA: DUF4097 family beta strand repeat-containing protein [Terriglobales bacterium]|nr:DUF4097 family beta strand repeat-containing protein [Terriglobales bacterium]
MRTGFIRLSGLVVLLLLASAAAVASEQGHFQKSFQVNTGAELQVYTHSGDIQVRSGPAGTISITGRIHVGDRWFAGGRKTEVEEIEKTPPIQQSGNLVRVDYVNHTNISIDYEITAPPDTKVRTKSGSGDQSVEGMQAGADIETGSGDVRLENVSGEMRLRTGSGNIRTRDVAGGFEARAGSGDITLEEKGKGDVRIETGSGNVEARGVNGGVNASTGSGDVRVEGIPASSWSIKTGSGNAELRLPQDAAFDVDASSSSGNIEVNHPVTTTVQGRVTDSHKSVRGKVRGGGPEVTAHTGSGNIRIE